MRNFWIRILTVSWSPEGSLLDLYQGFTDIRLIEKYLRAVDNQYSDITLTILTCLGLPVPSRPESFPCDTAFEEL